MQSSTDRNKNDLTALYATSVEREREARQRMEAYPPGSLERAQACREWSDAIVRTNHAWRRLSTSDAGRSREQSTTAQPERPHAGA